MLILDLILSGIDGFSVLETASRLSGPPRINRHLRTRAGQHRPQSLRHGGLLLLLKPFSMEALVNRALEPLPGGVGVSERGAPPRGTGTAAR